MSEEDKEIGCVLRSWNSIVRCHPLCSGVRLRRTGERVWGQVSEGCQHYFGPVGGGFSPGEHEMLSAAVMAQQMTKELKWVAASWDGV